MMKNLLVAHWSARMDVLGKSIGCVRAERDRIPQSQGRQAKKLLAAAGGDERMLDCQHYRHFYPTFN